MTATPSPGRLLLVPAPLDFGVRGDAAPAPLEETLPLGVIRQAALLSHWLVENAKSARAFLKRVDAVVPLARPLQAIAMIELPRPVKGGAADGAAVRPVRGRPDASAVDDAPPGLLAPALHGHDIGLLSEAGLPAVADPGARVVQQAHRLGIAVIALPGASSLVLALAASGLNGQSFAFAGYLPTEADRRAGRIRELESMSRRWQQTQLAIETPYRNAALLAALLTHLQPSTRLAVSSGLTLAGGWTCQRTVEAWRSAGPSSPALADDMPTVFAWLAG
jgi:16S rRNA (cytidine1402-2'-O)-methyltransferase